MSLFNMRALGSSTKAGALVDLENVVIGARGLLPRTHSQDLFHVIQDQVQGIPTRVATGQSVLNEYMPVLAGLGWGLTAVPTKPDAADQALIEIGLDFARSGRTDLVVVGGDHKYVDLAPYARLHVLSHPDSLSRRLHLAATTVTYLPPLTAAAQTRYAA